MLSRDQKLILVLVFIALALALLVINMDKEMKAAISKRDNQIAELKYELKTANSVKYIMKKYNCRNQIIFEEIMKAKDVGVDPVKVAIVIGRESEYNPFAVSSCGARGLMQISPCHGKNSTFDIRKNIRYGIRYMKEQRDRFGSDELMLAGYNAGPGAVIKYGGVPPFRETQLYIKFYNRMMEDVQSIAATT